ncbi:response regulator [Pseudomonas sp. GV071]|uniref:response regulator n=1 Tax=Pseudomonas sp. GV071 TaxID=2135754 RepID=UPI000D3A98EF|nr:response regulator [Pseudomonas sp. GV071]PTQ74092.1 two-component system sensor histidine kinase EvgS/two-component system response regulator EvgA [Pseudomonas sp. GV071]
MSRIAIAEEQTVTRHAIRLLLEAAGHEVVAEADNGLDALQQLRDLQPALLILELSLPRLGGLELIQRAKAHGLPAKLLVLTAQHSEYFAARCMEAGAHGFISKHEDLADMGKALDAVLHGHSYFPSHVLGTTQGDKHSLALKALSARELAVLQLLCTGMSNVAIGEQLALSDKTVSTYKIRLKDKLHATSQLELIDIARRHGLVDGNEAEAPLPSANLAELQLLQSMIDALPHAVHVRDTEGRMLACNAYYLEQQQVSLEQVLGKCINQTPELQDDDADLVHSSLMEAISAAVPYSRDVLVRLQGKQHVLRHWGKPHHDSNGQLLGMIFGSVDITDRDEQVLALRVDAEQGKVRMQARDQLLGHLTAELGEPLRGLVAMLDLGLTSPGKQQEALQVARAHADKLLALLNGLQQAGQLAGGHYEVVNEPLDLREVLAALVTQFQPQAQSNELNIALDVHTARHPAVWADPQALQQVLAALFGYGLQRLPNGQLMVRLAANGRGLGLVEVQVEVLALPAAEGALAAVASPAVELELALARKLVERLDGSLEVLVDEGGKTHLKLGLMLTQAELGGVV